MLQQFLVIDKLPDNPGLQNGNQRRDEIIITQSRRITVENKQEHDRHDIHHGLHAFHLIVLRLVFIIHNHIPVYGTIELIDEDEIVINLYDDNDLEISKEDFEQYNIEDFIFSSLIK